MADLGADSILSPFDRSVANGVQMKIAGEDIKFQFPPKVTGDSKNSNWETIWFPSWEPIKYYWGSEARVITVEAEWMATGSVWTPRAIAGQMRKIREYFYGAKVGGSVYPLVKLKIYDIVPSLANFRMMDFSVSFGDGIAGGAGLFPIYSKGTFKLELATKVTGKVKGTNGEDIDVKEPKVNVANLDPIQPDWK
jgi:hypothetical protein